MKTMTLGERVFGIVDDIIGDIKRGAIESDKELVDRVHEEAESSVVYTSSQMLAIICEEIWDKLYRKLKTTFGTDDYYEVFENLFACACCGERVYSEKGGWETEDGEVCEVCYEKHYTECKECGLIVDKNYCTDESVCYECAE